MDAYKLVVKFFVKDPPELPADAFVPVFHSWIQNQRVADHLLVDVADYQLVHNGPGTVLVAHEGNFCTDRAEGRLGLQYNRKQPLAGSLADKLTAVLVIALEGCVRLEEEAKLNGIRFGGDELVVRINDRLAAPNTNATFESIRGDLDSIMAELYAGAAVELHHEPHAEKLFEVRIKSSQSVSTVTLLERAKSLAALSAANG
jgi:hypothetical protein